MGNRDEVSCPECGEAQGDLWDYDWGQRESLTASCWSCGKDYVLVRHVSAWYEARRLPAPCPACGQTDTGRCPKYGRLRPHPRPPRPSSTAGG